MLTVALFLVCAIQACTESASAEEAVEYRVYSDEAYEAILTFYEYDQDMPLAARTVEATEGSNHIREKVVFNGVRDSRVPAYLGLPTGGAGPYPCVLLVNGITGTKERWWEEDSWPHGRKVTEQLFTAGFAVFALDAVYHGERNALDEFERPGDVLFRHEWYNRSRNMIKQTTVEYRRAIDYLATREEIDSDRIGVLGNSMGGLIIFALNASEPRVKVSVAGVTPIKVMTPPELVPISPNNFARGIGPRPFLMLMGKADPFYTVEESEQLFEMIEGGPKKLIFYESGHRLPEEYVGDAVAWLNEHLK
jgi:dienelactone hydrolase